MADRQGQSVILAMYTFVVGPWLPQINVISSGLIRKPGKKQEEAKGERRHRSLSDHQSVALLREKTRLRLCFVLNSFSFPEKLKGLKFLGKTHKHESYLMGNVV